MITKKPEKKTNFIRNIHFTNSARDGWELILKSLKPKSRVLLPSYIGVTEREGSGIYDSIVNTKIDHDFYLLNEDLSISISEIEKKIEKEEFSLILLVHYFGFKINDFDEVVDLCKKHKLIIVEDCAHLFNYNNYEISDVGLKSDFVFYSLHKNFPIKEGGMFIQNNLSLKFPDISNITLNKNYSEEIYGFDLNGIVKKRKENFKILEKLLKGNINITPLKTLKKDDIPHDFPIIVKNDLREKLYFWLIENNMSVIALYYKLIPPLLDNKYNKMVAISDSILNLPVHQDVNEKELIELIEKINVFYE
tara:strand:- start:1582 stop:2502 length:921 start_codon:yes stop_codon:yes gene_type:complete